MTAHVGAPARLLLVEDDQEIRSVLQALLMDEGYAVALAASLEEALALVDEQVFQVILTDLFAATPDAPLQTIQPLRARAYPTPVGVMTAWNIAPAAAQGAGLAFLVKKPFDAGELLTMIAACLCVPLSACPQTN